MTSTTTIDWTPQLLDQLRFQWDTQLRPRLEGLTDDEYHWEPVTRAPGACAGAATPRPRTPRAPATG